MGKWTRRAFLATGTIVGGGLLIGAGTAVFIRPGHRTPKLAKMFQGEDEVMVNAWVKLLPDNSIKVIVPHAEMGQGVHTALPMMLADEMDVDWSQVSMEEAPVHPEYASMHIARDFMLPMEVPTVLEDTLNGVFLKAAQAMNFQITGGSFSVRGTGVWGMRRAGAGAREILMRAAAEEWQVPLAELATEKGHVLHLASERKVPYIDLAEAAAGLKASDQPTLKQPDEFKIMGTRVERFDIPAKVDGTAVFGVDVELPDMLYGCVRCAPVFGATVTSFDASAAKSMPGVKAVVDIGNGVGVVADKYWRAKKALDQVEISFSENEAQQLDSEQIFSKFRADMDSAVANGDEEEDFTKGDARKLLAQAEDVIEAKYRVPYLAHATMEPLNATARVRDGSIELWSGLQNPLGTKNFLAEEFELEPENVKINNVYLGGGFGRRAQQDYPTQAVKLAQAVPGKAVKMIWSREEDIQQDRYRPAIVSRFRGALDADGYPQAWENQFVDKHEPVEAPTIPYKVDNQYVHYTGSPTHIPFGPWRSVDHTQHAFFTESFIDELAHHAGQDPFEYRAHLLREEPRFLKVLQMAAKMADWGKTMPEGWGQGIAIQRSFGTIVAEVADVNMSSGSPKVERVFCAADPGFAVSPDAFKAQMESGINYGLTAALYGKIDIDKGAVVQSNFHDYHMLRMQDAPEIDIEIINSGEKIGGAGEPGTPPIAPALTNAIYAITGKRIRELPVSDHV